jgi:hypothetical protein
MVAGVKTVAITEHRVLLLFGVIDINSKISKLPKIFTVQCLSAFYGPVTVAINGGAGKT